MTWSDAVSELNSSIGDYFGQLISYAPADGSATIAGITANCDIGQDYGMADLDMPSASVAAPLIGSMITLADASQWRIYDAGAAAYGYSPCDIRSIDNWHTSEVQYYTSGDWATHTTGLPVFIDPTSVNESYDPETMVTTTMFSGRCMYLATLTQKMRIIFDSRELYIVQALPDPTDSRYIDLVLQEDVRP